MSGIFGSSPPIGTAAGDLQVWDPSTQMWTISGGGNLSGFTGHMVRPG